jgi:hypothetical protein
VSAIRSPTDITAADSTPAQERPRRIESALEKIIAGETDNWSGDLRSGWTRFILSLLFRNPESVATIRGHIVEMWDEGLKALKADYAARRRAGDPESFGNSLLNTNPMRRRSARPISWPM